MHYFQLSFRNGRITEYYGLIKNENAAHSHIYNPARASQEAYCSGEKRRQDNQQLPKILSGSKASKIQEGSEPPMKPKTTRLPFYSTQPDTVRSNLRQALIQFIAFGEGNAKEFKRVKKLRETLKRNP